MPVKLADLQRAKEQETDADRQAFAEAARACLLKLENLFPPERLRGLFPPRRER